MNRLYSILDGICRYAAYLAAATLTLLFLLGLGDILARLFFKTSISIALEYSGYLVAASMFMGSGWTLLHSGHIRVRVISDKLSNKAQNLLEGFVLIFSIGVCSVMAYGLTIWTFGTYSEGQLSYFTSATPLWIPQAILATGPYILICALLARMIKLYTGEQETAS